MFVWLLLRVCDYYLVDFISCFKKKLVINLINNSVIKRAQAVIYDLSQGVVSEELGMDIFAVL